MSSRGDFWRDKRVFITGHTGFKGGWLSLWLQLLGAQLTGYALSPPTRPSLFESAGVGQGMNSVIADVRDLARLKEEMSAARPEIVFHLAAQPLVRRSYEAPIETISSNVLGTAHLLEAVRHTPGVRAVVCITSDKCYQNNEWLWGYRENDTLGGYDPYSTSKACAELVIATYRNAYFSQQTETQPAAVASTRAGNVIGGGDWARDRLVPDIMQAVMDGRPVVIRSPRATRPWQHVLEPLNGYLMLAQRLYQEGQEYAEPWNFGPDDKDVRPVSWIVDYITRMWGKGASWELDTADQPHENILLKLDCSKAKLRLGWAPRLDLATALDWIVEWFQAYHEQQPLRGMIKDQICRFTDLEGK